MISFESDASGIIEIIVSGDVTDEDIQGVTAKLEREREATGRLFIMEIVKDVGEVEPSPYWEDIKSLIKHGERGGKAAIVTDSKWKLWFNELLQPFVGTDIRVFETDQVDQARSWLRGEADAGTSLGTDETGEEA